MNLSSIHEFLFNNSATEYAEDPLGIKINCSDFLQFNSQFNTKE